MVDQESRVQTEEIIRAAKTENRLILTEVESKQIINREGIPVVETRLAQSKNEAVAIATEMGFPVALKTAVYGITHKSDSGGVKLDIKNRSEVGKAYNEIVNLGVRAGSRKRLKRNGVSIQRMAPSGVEVIMGISRDPQFGHVIMFGLGGIFVETLGDVAFRIVPIERKDAQAMIREIKGYPALTGYRGRKAVDVPALEDILLKISSLSHKMPEIKEIDINPVIALPEGALAVDARIVLEKTI